MNGKSGGVVFNDARTSPPQEPITEIIPDIEKNRLVSSGGVTKSLDVGPRPTTFNGQSTGIDGSVGRLTPPRIKNRRLSLESEKNAQPQMAFSQPPPARVRSEGGRRQRKGDVDSQ